MHSLWMEDRNYLEIALKYFVRPIPQALRFLVENEALNRIIKGRDKNTTSLQTRLLIYPFKGPSELYPNLGAEVKCEAYDKFKKIEA